MRYLVEGAVRDAVLRERVSVAIYREFCLRPNRMCYLYLAVNSGKPAPLADSRMIKTGNI